VLEGVEEFISVIPVVGETAGFHLSLNWNGKEPRRHWA
jgi:hypothetical protein